MLIPIDSIHHLKIQHDSTPFLELWVVDGFLSSFSLVWIPLLVLPAKHADFR